MLQKRLSPKEYLSEGGAIVVEVDGGNRWRWIAIRVIRRLAEFANIRFTVIPWGKSGDALPWVFDCQNCPSSFLSWVSLCNNVAVTCPGCGKRYLTMNDCNKAWIMHEISAEDEKWLIEREERRFANIMAVFGITVDG